MTDPATTRRPIAALPLPSSVTPGPVASSPPTFEEVDISDLMVDPAYQRELSQRSILLIHKMVRQWDWRNFKPPVVVRSKNRFLVIDGQHTAIAAATHGGIGRLPVMVVDADSQAEQAKAFLGHNKDRVAITNSQMFFAALAAGDETAIDTRNVCDRAGATILRNATPGRAYRPGEIASITTLVAIVRQRTAIKARRVIEICVKTKMAPIPANMIKAVDALLNEPDYAGEIADEDIVSTVIKMGPALERKALEISMAKRLPQWKATAIVVFQNTRRRRGSSGSN